MRLLLLASVFLLTCAFARAQEQEKKLIDRIMKPNTEMKVIEQDKSYGGGKGFVGAGKAPVKDFQYIDKVRPKEFATAGYLGSKSWAGDFKFSAQTANTTTRTIIPNTEKPYATSPMPVKDSRESGKMFATRTLKDGERPYLGPESKRLKTPVDQLKNTGWQGNLQPMSIDDVRELLNKTK